METNFIFSRFKNSFNFLTGMMCSSHVGPEPSVSPEQSIFRFVCVDISASSGTISNIGMNDDFKNYLTSELNSLRETGLYKSERIIASPQNGRIKLQEG